MGSWGSSCASWGEERGRVWWRVTILIPKSSRTQRPSWPIIGVGPTGPPRRDVCDSGAMITCARELYCVSRDCNWLNDVLLVADWLARGLFKTSNVSVMVVQGRGIVVVCSTNHGRAPGSVGFSSQNVFRNVSKGRAHVGQSLTPYRNN